MSECTCHDKYALDTLVPQIGIITDIRQETPDVKTFRVNAPEGGKLFEHMPGQCAMVCVPGVGNDENAKCVSTLSCSSASELRLEQFCKVLKILKQNAKLLLNANEQDSPLRPN